MKAKFALIALLALSLFGCDNNTANLGIGMLPENDQAISGKYSTFEVITKSVQSEHAYAKSNIGYVGTYTDETFGTYKAGFLAELHCPTGLTFPAVYSETTGTTGETKATGTMSADADDSEIQLIRDDNGNVIGNIHTVSIHLWYSSYFGDSLTACRLSVYELNNALEKDKAYYTDIDPEEYYVKTDKLGSAAYTAVDYTVSDSIRKTSRYVPSVTVNLDKTTALTLATKIMKAARTYGNRFSQTHFKDVFKGVYVNSDYGDGTVLYVDQVQLNIVSKVFKTDSITGVKLKKKNSTEDSIDYAVRPFVSTREVIQANRLTNDESAIASRIAETNCTYLKSPTGIFTEATLPIADIESQLSSDTLNAVKLTFSCFNSETGSTQKVKMSAPKQVMLIRKKEKDTFFTENKIQDGVTSYVVSISSNDYIFTNIARLVTTCIAEKKAAQEAQGSAWNETQWLADNPDWNKVVLIPVQTATENTYTYSGASVTRIYSVLHDLKPGFARLKGGSAGETNADYRLTLEVLSTQLK